VDGCFFGIVVGRANAERTAVDPHELARRGQLLPATSSSLAMTLSIVKLAGS
jgi:hypothetical protein